MKREETQKRDRQCQEKRVRSRLKSRRKSKETDKESTGKNKILARRERETARGRHERKSEELRKDAIKREDKAMQ
jgi:hypothetical protein